MSYDVNTHCVKDTPDKVGRALPKRELQKSREKICSRNQIK